MHPQSPTKADLRAWLTTPAPRIPHAELSTEERLNENLQALAYEILLTCHRRDKDKTS